MRGHKLFCKNKWKKVGQRRTKEHDHHQGVEKYPKGSENLVQTKETKIESPQQTKSHKRRKRTSKQVNITKTPMELPEIEPMRKYKTSHKNPWRLYHKWFQTVSHS